MESNGIRIRVGDVIYGIIKRRNLILALTAVGLVIGVLLSGVSYLRGEMSKEYMVTSSFSVNTRTVNGLFTSGYDFPNYNDINMAEDITDAVAYVMKSDKMLTQVIDSLGLLGVTTKDIEENLNLSPYNETQIIEMTLYWRSSQEGISILSELNRLAPQMLQETLSIGSVSVINEPSSKYLVGGSLNVVLWGYMAVLGFGLGIGITLLELIMHPTLLNVQDLGNVFGLEVLCEIADDKAFFERKGSLVLDDEEQSDVSESYASAAHIIQNRLRKQPAPHIIYITSALRGEGKTSTIANLAIQLSDLEKRVLLIDFDMKNPNLGSYFLNNVEYEHSLNALYAGDINEKEAITTLTGYLDLIPTLFERSSIPLDSNLFGAIEKLAANYDYVLIDTAPVGVTADPMSLSQLASGALFVARYDTASMQEIKEALERIEKSGISILGCVANGIQVSERGINNPVKEKDKVEKARHHRQNSTAPLTTLEPEPEQSTAPSPAAVIPVAPMVPETPAASAAPEAPAAKQDLISAESMLEEFMRSRAAVKAQSAPAVTTDDSFVNLLFQAENNRASQAEPPQEKQQ